MTGAPDGDVDRALAAMGATPLKYYSFGVMAVRPPEHERARSDGTRSEEMGTDRPVFPFGISTQGGLAPPLPPSGEGTSERYRSHSVASVFPLLGLALPEAFHIDVEPVWPVGPPVSEQSVIFDRSTLADAMGTGHVRHETMDQSRFATNVDMFPHEAVKSSPTVYATPPDGETQTSSANGGLFVMPAWLDPAAAANGSVNASPNPPPLPLPWLENLPNVALPEPVRPPPKTDALPDWPKPTQASSDLPASQPNYGASVYSPFVQNNVTTPDGSFEKTQQAAANSQQSLPPWLQDAVPSRTGEPQARHVDWSLPNLSEHQLDAHNPSASPETSPEPVLAHPMPAFAPPTTVHKTEPQPLRNVTQAEPTLLPEPVPHEQISAKPVHEVAYTFSASDPEPTWHEPPLETSHPDFVEVNKPHFAAPEITDKMGAPAPPPNTYEFSDPWTGSASLPADKTDELQMPPVHIESNRDTSDQPFAALPAVTPSVSASKAPTPASSRPLADLFRTLGGGGGGSGLPRSDERKEW